MSPELERDEGGDGDLAARLAEAFDRERHGDQRRRPPAGHRAPEPEAPAAAPAPTPPAPLPPALWPPAPTPPTTGTTDTDEPHVDDEPVAAPSLTVGDVAISVVTTDRFEVLRRRVGRQRIALRALEARVDDVPGADDLEDLVGQVEALTASLDDLERTVADLGRRLGAGEGSDASSKRRFFR
jgi:hypothetical protein